MKKWSVVICLDPFFRFRIDQWSRAGPRACLSDSFKNSPPPPPPPPTLHTHTHGQRRTEKRIRERDVFRRPVTTNKRKREGVEKSLLMRLRRPDWALSFHYSVRASRMFVCIDNPLVSISAFSLLAYLNAPSPRRTGTS